MNEKPTWERGDSLRSVRDVTKDIVIPTTERLLTALREQVDMEADQKLKRLIGRATRVVEVNCDDDK